MQGKMKFYNGVKGYGFISGSDGKDYFFHFKELRVDKATKKRLPEFQNINMEFEPGEREKGPFASSVKIPQGLPEPATA